MPSRFLTHANPDTLALQLDDHWFHMEPKEPHEIESTFYCDKLMEIYGPTYGLVEIHITRSRTGISLDIESALKEANKALRKSYNLAIRRYVDDQITDRIRKGLPALPPHGRADEGIKVLKINLKQKYGFTPVTLDDDDDTPIGHTHPAVGEITAPPVEDPRIAMFQHQLDKQERLILTMAKALGVDPKDLEDGDEEPAKPKGKGKAAKQEEPQPTAVEA